MEFPVLQKSNLSSFSCHRSWLSVVNTILSRRMKELFQVHWRLGETITEHGSQRFRLPRSILQSQGFDASAPSLDFKTDFVSRHPIQWDPSERVSALSPATPKRSVADSNIWPWTHRKNSLKSSVSAWRQRTGNSSNLNTSSKNRLLLNFEVRSLSKVDAGEDVIAGKSKK